MSSSHHRDQTLDAVGRERVALPFVPKARAASRDIGAVALFEHHPLDRGVAGAGANILQLLEALRLDQLGQVESLGIEPRNELLEPLAALGPAHLAQVLLTVEQYVVQPNEGGISTEHLLADVLAAEPLLERVEARRRAAVEVGHALV